MGGYRSGKSQEFHKTCLSKASETSCLVRGGGGEGGVQWGPDVPTSIKIVNDKLVM